MSDGMYGSRAALYDLLYSENRDYAAQARRVRSVLTDFGVDDGADLLEVACGTGCYLEELDRWYDMTGTDLSEDMLEIAARKLPDIELFEADMTDFETDRQYDAVLCLFSSIGYVEDRAELEQTVHNFYDAVKPGGVVVIEPWDQFEEGRPGMKTYEDDDLKICRQYVARRDGNKSIWEFHWLVARRDRDVEYFTDRHVTTLFSPEEYRAAIESAGFDVTDIEPTADRRRLWVGEK